MTHFETRRLLRLSFFGALLLALPQAAATPVAGAPEEGQRPAYFEVRPAAGQVVMVPLGEGDRTGWHLKVTVDKGVLQSAKYQAACGPVLLNGTTADRIPAFVPAPSLNTAAPDQTRVCGQTGCTCANAPAGIIHVSRAPELFVAIRGEDAPSAGPVLPGGDAPAPVAEDAAPGCFGWLELVVDASGLRVGTEVLATVAYYVPGAPLNGSPTRVEPLLAAVVAP